MEERIIVSFDFDSTLQLDVLDADGDVVGHAPNVRIVDLLRDHHSKGNKVLIVTTRLDKFMDEVHEFVRVNELPVLPEDIHNTNMAWKRNTLRRLKVNMHFDDNVDELKRIKHAPNIRGKLVEDPPLNVNNGENNEE